MKRHSKIAGVSAVAITILGLAGNEAVKIVSRIVESRLAPVEAVAKDDSDFKDAVIMDLVDRVSELEKQMKAKQ
jgi:hypothetical protein